MRQKLILLMMVALLIFSCRSKNKNEDADTLTSGLIAIAVDENLENIINSQLDAFAIRYPQAYIFPMYMPEKEAMQQVIDDSVKLAITARDLDAYEKSILPETRVIRKYVFGYEGVAFVINRNNNDSILSKEQIKDILLGKINTWKEINPNSPLDTIKIFFANKHNGVIRYISDSITRGTKNVSENIYALREGENMFDKISENRDYIGIIGLNQIGNINSKIYNKNSSKIRLVRVSKDNSQEGYLPYAGDVYIGDYPFWRPIYAHLAETRDGLPKGFTFFLTQQVGQKVMLKAGFMPITDANKRLTRWNE